jgi:hypothetical protein
VAVFEGFVGLPFSDGPMLPTAAARLMPEKETVMSIW